MSSQEESLATEADDASVVPDVHLVWLWLVLVNEADFEESFVTWVIKRYI